MDQIDYFDVGTPEEPVVSNSSLSAINPEEGGSIVKFFNFFTAKDEKAEHSKTSLKRGKLIHSYIENPQQFIIEPELKPTEMMAGLLEKAVQLNSDALNGFSDRIKDIDATINGSSKKAETAQAEKLQLQDCFEKLAKILNQQIEPTIKLFRCARVEAKAYASLNEHTLLDKIVNLEETKAVPYLNFLLGSREKLVLDAATHKVVEGCLNSLHTHKEVSTLLGLNQDPFGEMDKEEVFREQPIFWREIITIQDSIKVPIMCKALLDRIVVNHQTKRIVYVDLKTTGHSIYLFQNSFEKYRYYRQMAYYRHALFFWFNNHYANRYNFRDYSLDILIVPVETQGLHLTGVYDVDATWLGKGTLEAKNLLHRTAWHIHYKESRYALEEIGPDNTYRHLRFKAPV